MSHSVYEAEGWALLSTVPQGLRLTMELLSEVAGPHGKYERMLCEVLP